MTYAVRILGNNGARIVNPQNGATVRTIPGKYTNGIVQGDEVHLTQESDGKIKIVNVRSGAVIRVL